MDIFTTYFDESGTHQGSPIFVIAGWMASDEQWNYLRDEWRPVLDEYSITAFHMKDFAHSKKEYKNLSEDDRRNLLRRLVDLLLSRVEVGVFGAIHLPSYEEIMAENPDRKKVFGNPFTLVAMFALDAYRRWATENNLQESTAYVYEAGAAHSGEFRNAYEQSVKDPKFSADYRHNSFRFGNKSEIPLQAADLLAYEIYSGLRNIEIEGMPRDMRWPLQQFIARGFAPYGVYHDGEKLKGFVSRIEAGSEGV